MPRKFLFFGSFLAICLISILTTCCAAADALSWAEKLAASCRETVNLGVLDAGGVVVISTVESPQSIRMSSKVGNRRCLYSTALGKVLLSGLSWLRSAAPGWWRGS